MKKTILMIEDDRALRDTTAGYLEGEGYRVLSAGDGEEGLSIALKEKIDLILVDIMLPGMAGFDVCRRLREKGNPTPLIFLTGKKKDEIDKVLGLEIGADDYVVKPFGQRELLARINAVLRRARGEVGILEAMTFDDIQIDFKKKLASRGGEPLVLTAKEFGLIQLLAAHEGEVISRDRILNEVWGYEKFPTTRTVDTFVHNLRQKIEKNPSQPVHLLTVPWMGYKFIK